MIYGISLIVLGLLAAPSLLLSKQPDAKDLLDKITPYQGWIGLIFCLWGVWNVLSALLNLSILSHFPIWWMTWMASSFTKAILGFILGYGMINKVLLSKNDRVRAKADHLRTQLVPLKRRLGVIGVGIGIWVIIASALFNN